MSVFTLPSVRLLVCLLRRNRFVSPRIAQCYVCSLEIILRYVLWIENVLECVASATLFAIEGLL